MSRDDTHLYTNLLHRHRPAHTTMSAFVENIIHNCCVNGQVSQTFLVMLAVVLSSVLHVKYPAAPLPTHIA